VVRLHLPPLRERAEDIRELVLHFAAWFSRRHARPIAGVTAAALDRLALHSWPGNVRELGNVMERAVLSAPGEVISIDSIQLDVTAPRPAVAGEALPGYAPLLPMADVEALHIARVLREVDGHLGKAAEILGLHRNTVSRKAQEYGIQVTG
jgi:DNA-binding NtrC family response regulator